MVSVNNHFHASPVQSRALMCQFRVQESQFRLASLKNMNELKNVVSV